MTRRKGAVAADARGNFSVHAASKEREEVQGLTVAKALSADGIEEVECLLYPGDGQITITGAMVRDSSMQTCHGHSRMESDA
jgi:hypothetical protein